SPGAVARAQELALVRAEDRSILGKMFGMFKSRPPVPTQTTAASSAADSSSDGDSAPAPVRGGTTGAAGSPATSTGDSSGAFTIDPTKPTVVKPQTPQPAKKFR